MHVETDGKITWVATQIPENNWHRLSDSCYDPLGSEPRITLMVVRPFVSSSSREFETIQRGRMQLPKAITITNSMALADGGSEILVGITDDGGPFEIHLHQWMFEHEYRGRLSFNRHLVEFRSSDEAAIVDLIRNASFEHGDRYVNFRDWRRPEVIWREYCDRFVARILAPIPPLSRRMAKGDNSGSMTDEGH